MKKTLILLSVLLLTLSGVRAQDCCFPWIDGEQPYTGDSVKPALSFSGESCGTLVEGVDYTATWYNNVEPGYASVFIQSMSPDVCDAQIMFTIVDTSYPDLDADEKAILLALEKSLGYTLKSRISITDGHVRSVSMYNEPLTKEQAREFFRFPYMEEISLSRCPLNCAAEDLVDPNTLACGNTLKKLNITYTGLSGNIGVLANYFPNLTDLTAYNNHLTDEHPAITHVNSVNLRYQQLDSVYTLNLREPFTKESFLATMPELMFMEGGSLRLYWQIWRADNKQQCFSMRTFYAGDGSRYPIAGAFGESIFYVTEDDTLSCKETANRAYGSTFFMKMLFLQGDANISGTVDISDLQTVINYIIGNYVSKLHVCAADLYKDSVLNVQDVVLMVDTLLQHNEPVALAPHRAAATDATEVSEAALYWLNGELHLRSNRAVAAMQLSLDGEVEWQMGKEWMHREAATGQGVNTVFWSLSGVTLPANTDVVIARSASEPAIRYTALSDAEAEPIRIGTGNQVATGIESMVGPDSEFSIHKVLRDGQLYLMYEGQMYDVQGKRIGNW